MKQAVDSENTVIFSTASFPPVEYMACMLKYKKIWLEGDENFNKQSYRNRYIINSSNGPLNQVILVKRLHYKKTKVTKVGVDYSLNWPEQFWRAVFAAYNNSPFFLFYQDDLKTFFQKRFNTLWEFNWESMQMVMDWIGLEKEIYVSLDFRKYYNKTTDLRYNIHPKCPSVLKMEPWTQVFDKKYGFNPKVSILDLLFNKGPESYIYLKNMANQDILS
ncbi:MAG: WbqC family protein [Bacteroidales bacterium]|nr:WbqC family protein [Bacteroidales bacterium]